jgi:preprotein translocase subunit SecY
MRIFEVFNNIFKIEELRRRIFITLMLLIVFRLGAHIPLPGVNLLAIEEFQKQAEGTLGGLWELLQIFSGAAFGNLALFSLGIMPYITASIIMSLLTKVHPKLEAIAKEGPAGYRKINQYTRLLTLPICIMQAFMGVSAMRGRPIGDVELISADAGFGTLFMMIAGLSAGAIFIMWLGEQITEHGIGNGASILIMAGIVARMPAITMNLIEGVQRGEINMDKVVLIFALYAAIIISIVYITQAQRRIPVQSARIWKGRRVTISQRNYLPLKVNQAGVMPVIFASSLLVIPSIIALLPGLSGARDFLSRGDFFFIIIYCGMIIFFAYFWTFLFFPPDETAKNLKEYGSFIPGIRPGQKTAEYLNEILKKITLCGAVFLCVVALMPDLASGALGLQRYRVAFLGGTGILIVVGVGMDIMNKIESYLLLHHYKGFGEKGTPLRGRR